MPKPKILYATTNDHKIKLFRISWKKLNLDQKFELVTLKDLPKQDLGYIAEDSGTFGGDSLIKAKAYSKAYNLPTISQDRGFIFDALNWPGTDTKKVFTLDKTHEFKKGKWGGVRDEYFERSKEILAKINGLDRSMTIIQGLAITLPSGEFEVEEFRTKGVASMEPKMFEGFGGGLYGWFFLVPEKNHTISEFQTVEEIYEYESSILYPITDKILEFLEAKIIK
jgi:inosine/xanthosine triphosphate pyrophosphatase family protein